MDPILSQGEFEGEAVWETSMTAFANNHRQDQHFVSSECPLNNFEDFNQKRGKRLEN